MPDCASHIYSFLHLLFCSAFLQLLHHLSCSSGEMWAYKSPYVSVCVCVCVFKLVESGFSVSQCWHLQESRERRLSALQIWKPQITRWSIYEKKPHRNLQYGITHFLICNSKGVRQGSNHNQTYTDVYRQNKEKKGLKALMSVLPRGSESMKHEGIGLLHTRNALHNQTLCHMGQKREGKSGNAVC